jgi:hypothetical protein
MTQDLQSKDPMHHSTTKPRPIQYKFPTTTKPRPIKQRPHHYKTYAYGITYMYFIRNQATKNKIT